MIILFVLYPKCLKPHLHSNLQVTKICEMLSVLLLRNTFFLAVSNSKMQNVIKQRMCTMGGILIGLC